MRKVLTSLTLFAFALYAADPAREQTLQRAIDLMESKGDLAKAMPLFEDAARSADKALAARALLYLGQVQERQGADKARAIYERIIKEFGNQTETVVAARKRLSALGGAPSAFSLAKRFVCSECGDSESDFSPDGRLMLMTDWKSGDLAIREMATGKVRRLMAKTSSVPGLDEYGESPLFSADLRQAVYLWHSNENYAQLRIVANEPASKPRVLLDTPENKWYEPAAWSSDGKSILVFILRPDDTWQLAWVSAANGAVKVLKSLEWRLRADMPVRHARLSPDGRYIAYSILATNPKTGKRGRSLESTDMHIYLLAADGSSETVLVKTAGINESPVWTPDGNHLLFTSDRSGSFGLWSVAIHNGKAVGNPSLVMADTGRFASHGMTRSGSYYYRNNGWGVENVSIVEAGQGAITTERFVGIRPTWSPDGKQLAFLRHRPASGGDNYDLVVHSLEAGDEKLYSINGLRTSAPRWYRDGKSILVFVRSTGKSTGWYRLDLASKEFSQILEFDESVLQVGPLSRDEQTIYAAGYATGKDGGVGDRVVDRIVAIDVQTRQQRQVSPLPATAFVGIQLSPDGRTLAIRYVDPETRRTHFARVGINGSDYREIHTGDTGVRYDNFAWTNDGRWILFGVQQDEKWKIMRIPAEGGNPEATDFDVSNAGTLQNISLSPDGRRLVFSAIKRVQELWAIDNLLSVLK